ncbi:MAG: EamA family transporter [Candidatus Eisenbacteria bacterium]|nr:EamA family transporter [Candidatus Eisenbacteria bacterium]
MSTPQRQAAIGRWLVFAATVFWASTATLARFLFHERQVNPLVVVELRLAIATTILAVLLVAFRRASLRVERRDVPYFLLLGLLGVAAVQGSYFYTISRLGVGLAILIQYLAPVLIVAFDLVRGRRVGWTMIAAVLCALVGTGLLVGNVNPGTLDASPLDWGIAFLSAFVFAFYIVASKRGLARYRPETVLLYTFAIAGLFWAFVNPPWVILKSGYDAQLWGMFLLLGLFSTLVPFALFYMGLRRLPAAEASVIATTEPLVAMVLAAVFLHEHLGPLQLVGAALVLATGVLASRNKPEAIEASVERG